MHLASLEKELEHMAGKVKKEADRTRNLWMHCKHSTASLCMPKSAR